MPLGIYKAVKRRKEATTTTMLTYNLQIWLAIFAFTTFFVSILIPLLWGWGMILSELSSLQWVGFFVGCVFTLLLAAMGLYSLFNTIKLLWRAKFGEVVEINKNWSANILAAIEPLKGKGMGSEYAKAIKILIKSNEKLIEENKKLISEYLSIVENKDNMEGGGDNGRTT